MVVDAQGRAYVGNFGYDFAGGREAADGDARAGAARRRRVGRGDELAFPNGTVITPDGSTLDPRRDVRSLSHRVRHRSRRHALEPQGVGGPRLGDARRHLPRRSRRASGSRIRRTPSACASSKAETVTDRIPTDAGLLRVHARRTPIGRTLHLITGLLTADVARLVAELARPSGDGAGRRPGRGAALSTYAATMDQRSQARHRHRRHRHQGRSGERRDGRAHGRSLPAAHAEARDAEGRRRDRRGGRQALRLQGHGRVHVPGGREARGHRDRVERRQVVDRHRTPGCCSRTRPGARSRSRTTPTAQASRR